MSEHLNETLEYISSNLIPRYSWSLMTEEQKDDLMSGIVLPRWNAVTSDGTKLTASTWAAILGTTADAIGGRVYRLQQSRKPADETSPPALSESDKSGFRSTKSTLAKKPEAVSAFVESLEPEQRYELGKALTQVPASAPVSAKREQDGKAAVAPLGRMVDSVAAKLGTVSLIERATSEINEAVARNGLDAAAMNAIEAAYGELGSAIEFAKEMGGVK